MRLEDLRRNYVFSSSLLFLLAGSVGWSVFNLQVVSIVRLLEVAGIEFLPGLMLAQAGLSWIILKVWGKSAQGSSGKFLYSAFAMGCVTVLAAHPRLLEMIAQWTGGSRPWTMGALFIMSQLGINALRMGIHVIFSRRVSLLSNPQVSAQLSIAEESGFMVGVVASLWDVGHGEAVRDYMMGVLPFVAGVSLIVLLGDGTRKRAPEKLTVVASTPKTTSRRLPSFFGWMVSLFAMVASLKALQWFGMAYGLSEANRQGIQLMGLFSKLGLIQSSLTLLILAASLRFSSQISTWGFGFRMLLSAQGAAAAVMALSPMPNVFMGSEALRKVVERGFLGRSLQLLTSALPDEQRFESRHFMERWSTTLGTLVAGLLAFLTMQGYVPMSVLWSSMMGMAVMGLYLRRRLFQSLCDFHVARLRQAKLQGVLQACQVLGNPDCKHHHAALTSLLEHNPRPVVKKSILRALGLMEHPPVVPALMGHVKSDREDIQLAAVKAVNHYRGHEINFVLLNELREMVRSELPIRISVVRCITERLDRLVVPYLVEVLESNPDQRVAANAVEILGEVAVAEKDEDLMAYISKFLDPKYPRRVRANAVVVLYHHKAHGTRALEAFDRFITSDEIKELDAAAYIMGVLKLRGHESFILERSEACDHSNITCLVSLLRLGNLQAPRLLAGWLASPNEAKARETLVRLSVLPPHIRARVFYEVIECAPDSLSLVFTRMRKSQRDLETDRELIREEAQRLGLQLVEEDAWNHSESPAKDAA